ncbi:unnamed protein product [Ambrosiozyma monospora]|uniref:Unnamed protein product n=1 Tax=Ambrosiozyma monospora TaxID=43982 RepID=A0ACB5T5M5_AMBMO|nr:unnamed protein product [Ambrosiozyma monospora]
MYTTGEYSYDGSRGTSTVQVGFGVSVDSKGTGETGMDALVKVHPRTDVGEGEYEIPVQWVYSAVPIPATLGGDVPLSTLLDSDTDTQTHHTEADATPSVTSTLPPATSSPVVSIDVNVPESLTINVARFSAINDDLHYVPQGETFFGNGEIIFSQTQIKLDDSGKFDAVATLDSHYSNIKYVATADNKDKTLYPVEVSVAYTYEGVAEAFMPQITGTAARDGKKVKRAGGGSRTFKATYDTKMSTSITHNTLTSTKMVSPATTVTVGKATGTTTGAGAAATGAGATGTTGGATGDVTPKEQTSGDDNQQQQETSSSNGSNGEQTSSSPAGAGLGAPTQNGKTTVSQSSSAAAGGAGESTPTSGSSSSSGSGSNDSGNNNSNAGSGSNGSSSGSNDSGNNNNNNNNNSGSNSGSGSNDSGNNNNNNSGSGSNSDSSSNDSSNNNNDSGSNSNSNGSSSDSQFWIRWLWLWLW